MAEQLICNQQVGGSIPSISSNTFRGVPERPKGADCKSVSTAFDGSNPSPSTNICGSGSGVEHRLAKARVASSNLVFRSTYADVVQW